jgi:hypothetical protein
MRKIFFGAYATIILSAQIQTITNNRINATFFTALNVTTWIYSLR